MVWLTATRTAKLLPHLWYRPQDIVHVPAFILFGYYFAVMKIYALCTLHEVRNLRLFKLELSLCANDEIYRPDGVLVLVLVTFLQRLLPRISLIRRSLVRTRIRCLLTQEWYMLMVSFSPTAECVLISDVRSARCAV